MIERPTPNTRNYYLTPLAIIFAGVLIAGAIVVNADRNKSAALVDPSGNQTTLLGKNPNASTDNVRPVTAEDHIKGNPNAPVMIVEYSDFECPFCKQLHMTMNQIMTSELGTNGTVAWVYRHFPIDQIHPIKARAEAVASECAAELGGNNAFWEFADRFFAVTPSNNDTDIETVIPQIIREIGLNEEAFNTCYTSGKYDEHIQADYENAVATGGVGTPWSVVIAPNGTTYPLGGALPYATITQLIDIASQEE